MAFSGGGVLEATDHLMAANKMQEALGEIALKHAGTGSEWDVSDDPRLQNPENATPGHFVPDKVEAPVKGGKMPKYVAPPMGGVPDAANSEDEEDSDDEFLRELENNEELNKIRSQRLTQMREKGEKRAELLGKGHGQYRMIVQDEFLPEVTSSDRVVCHFFHRDFEKCKVLDHHLSILAREHIEAKFISIDAEKAPFFIEKLQLRVLPTIIMFHMGIAKDRIVGYEGLVDGLTPDHYDEFPTRALAKRLSTPQGDKDCPPIIDYTPPPTDDELEEYGLKKGRSIFGSIHNNDYDEEDD